MNLDPRCRILVEYAKWTALSAVRQGPIRAREPVYQLLDGVAFSKVLNRSLEPISCKEFDEWHRCETDALCCRATNCLPAEWAKELPIGWGAKLINVFLKTTSYAGDLGRGGLRAVLHPPLDTGLKQGLIQHFEERRRLDMLEKVKKFQTITGIRNYAMYRTVIEGCCAAAEDLECVLIEVEQLAGLGLRDGEGPPGALVEDICRGQARRSSRLRSAASAAAKASRT